MGEKCSTCGAGWHGRGQASRVRRTSRLVKQALVDREIEREIRDEDTYSALASVVFANEFRDHLGVWSRSAPLGLEKDLLQVGIISRTITASELDDRVARVQLGFRIGANISKIVGPIGP